MQRKKRKAILIRTGHLPWLNSLNDAKNENLKMKADKHKNAHT